MATRRVRVACLRCCGTPKSRAKKVTYHRQRAEVVDRTLVKFCFFVCDEAHWTPCRRVVVDAALVCGSTPTLDSAAQTAGERCGCTSLAYCCSCMSRLCGVSSTNCRKSCHGVESRLFLLVSSTCLCRVLNLRLHRRCKLCALLEFGSPRMIKVPEKKNLACYATATSWGYAMGRAGLSFKVAGQENGRSSTAL